MLKVIMFVPFFLLSTQLMAQSPKEQDEFLPYDQLLGVRSPLLIIDSKVRVIAKRINQPLWTESP